MQTRVESAPLSPAAIPVSTDTPASSPSSEGTAFGVLGGISFAHMLNDMIQSLILAIYPILKSDFHLSFAQVGLITLTYQLTASMLQPLV
ncbi:MAG: MFS transporter, partial [Pseudomonadota bacterium]